MKRRSAPTQLGPAAVPTTLSLVDRALATASHRGAFERDEATRLLRAIGASVEEPGLAGAVGTVVENAVVSYGGDRLVDRSRVVDALLDIRLLVQCDRRFGPVEQAGSGPEITAALAR